MQSKQSGSIPPPLQYVLVADDDEDARSFVAAVLRRAGLNVCEACDGEELLERYRALQVLAADGVMVVSDVGMPGCDGISATGELRKASPQLPIVIVTGLDDAATSRLAYEAGADLVLIKPVGRHTLLDAVRILMQRLGHDDPTPSAPPPESAPGPEPEPEPEPAQYATAK